MAKVEKQELTGLFKEVRTVNNLPKKKIQLTGISINTRELAKGNLYLAIPGTKVDGHDFIPAAVKQGAAAVVGLLPSQDFQDLPVPYLQVQDTRQTLAQLTAAWYDFPARKMVIIGVTGTDGKTTTVNLIYQILLAAGIQAGLISTVNAVIGDKILDTGFHVTTPEAQDLQRYLVEMVEAGITHVVLEATSHGLAQKRVAACEFDIGAITNITHEHLDFHGDYRGYLDAKSELLRLVSNSFRKDGFDNKLVVLNKDDQSYLPLLEVVNDLKINMVDYGTKADVDISAGDIHQRNDGITFLITQAGDKTKLITNLIGEYNVLNCLAAAAVCRSGLGLSWQVIEDGIRNLPGIPGRMESFDLGQDFQVLVDFAHTPNALEKALSAGRNITSGKVIAVFGSAGLRDQEKRRLMAEVSAEQADLTILTAEDPRTESLDGILAEMAAGVEARGGVEDETYWRIPDRGNAIRFAMQLSNPGDLVIVCGKGHEKSMCFGEIEHPWDDRTAVLAALSEHLGITGPEMPYLPTQNNE